MTDYKGPPPIDQRWTFHPTDPMLLMPVPENPPVPSESTLQEAHRLTHGPRRADYGHPLDDYTRTAGMVNAMLSHKLKEPLLAEDVTMIMQCVKLSRHVNAPKRDNMVDEAGYAWATWEIKEERDRRGAK